MSNQDPDPDRSNNTDVFVAAAEGRVGAAQAHHVERARTADTSAWSPDSKSIAYTQGAEVKLEEYSQAKPAVVTLDGKVSYPAAKPWTAR